MSCDFSLHCEDLIAHFKSASTATIELPDKFKMQIIRTYRVGGGLKTIEYTFNGRKYSCYGLDRDMQPIDAEVHAALHARNYITTPQRLKCNHDHTCTPKYSTVDLVACSRVSL